MKRVVSLILFLLFTYISRADQAACLSKNEAIKAKDFISQYSEVAEFCYPCGDRQANIVKIKDLKIIKDCDYEVSINGKSVDLAYLYYPIGNGQWENVARKLGITVHRVPDIIKVELVPITKVYQLTCVDKKTALKIKKFLNKYSELAVYSNSDVDDKVRFVNPKGFEISKRFGNCYVFVSKDKNIVDLSSLFYKKIEKVITSRPIFPCP